jgi:hypothetical protein
MAKKSKVDHS